jgi:hypothetical protein
LLGNRNRLQKQSNSVFLSFKNATSLLNQSQVSLQDFLIFWLLYWKLLGFLVRIGRSSLMFWLLKISSLHICMLIHNDIKITSCSRSCGTSTLPQSSTDLLIGTGLGGSNFNLFFNLANRQPTFYIWKLLHCINMFQFGIIAFNIKILLTSCLHTARSHLMFLILDSVIFS